MSRKTWDQYFMDIANIVKTRSTCLRNQVGAVIVRDKRIISTGYNGSPRKVHHCDKTGCRRADYPRGEGYEKCMSVHAEQNAIIQAAYMGISTEGAVIYSTTRPCNMCAKIIINAGIKRVVYDEEHVDEFAMELFKEANIDVVHINKGVVKYE